MNGKSISIYFSYVKMIDGILKINNNTYKVDNLTNF